MPDETPGPKWTVTDIVQTTRITSAGRFEEVYQYTVDTWWGGSFQITVPVVMHSPEVARSSIEAEFALLERGRMLTG